jgi:phosphoglycerate dehydrogenase-like enzyme
MLSAIKKLIPIDSRLRNHDWSDRYQDSRILLLQNRNALILGYGKIGYHIGKVCHSLGMNVRAIKNCPNDNGEDHVEIFSIDILQKLLEDTQALFVCLPLTENTRGILGAKELSLLPDSACVINVSRGEIIDEKALYNELAKGRICAGLDVWYNYPQSSSEYKDVPPAKHPFEDLDNVIMTPHLAGHTDQSEILRMRHLAKIINKIVRCKYRLPAIKIDNGY